PGACRRALHGALPIFSARGRRGGKGRPQGAGLLAAHPRGQADQTLGLRGEGGAAQLLGHLVRALQAGAAHLAAPPGQVRKRGPGRPRDQHRRPQDGRRGAALRGRPHAAHAHPPRRRQQGPRTLQPAPLPPLPPGRGSAGSARLPAHGLHQRHREAARRAGGRAAAPRGRARGGTEGRGDERGPMTARRTAAALLVLFAPLFASAQSLRVTNTTLLEYRGNNENGVETDDDYGVGLNKLYLDGNVGDTSGHLQIDGVYFTTTPDASILAPGQPSGYVSELRLERFRLQHEFEEVTVLGGDTHLQLGRGIALSLRKVDELGLDQALRGGNVIWQGDVARLQAFAGITNIANLDGVTQRHLEDPNDTLVGASATFHLGPADLSLHGLYLQPREPVLRDMGDDFTTLGGAFVDLPISSGLSL